MAGQAAALTLPVSQRSTSWASYSSARVNTYWITACEAAAAPTPTSTSRYPVAGPATSRTSTPIPIAPATAATETPTPSTPRTTMVNTAAALAPWLTPMTSGLASGLRSVVWKMAPLTPKADPTSTASTARGSLVSISTYDAPGISAPNRIRKKSGTVKVKSPSRTRAAKAPSSTRDSVATISR